MRTKKEGKQWEQIMSAFAALKKKNTKQNSEETLLKRQESLELLKLKKK